MSIDDKTPFSYMQLIDKYLGVVNEEIDRLNHTVVDFLFAVRPMDMDQREGNINALLMELTNFVGIELERSHIDTVLELADNLPLIKFDERYMKQVLLNLIKNAMAAMSDGGVLTIKTQVSDTDLFISVYDTGDGIAEENLSKIFEPYFTTKPSGSGLGLTLVYKIIREHQGEVSVKSKQGEGTCFIISLPIPQKERRLIGYGDSGRASGAGASGDANDWDDGADCGAGDIDERFAVEDDGEPTIEKLRRLGSLGAANSKYFGETTSSGLGDIIASNFKATARSADSGADGAADK
jgi:hypothetical protein